MNNKRNNAKNDFDFYETPTQTIESLCKWLISNGYQSERFYDPCVGRGQILKTLRANGFKSLSGSDLRADNIYGTGGVDFLNDCTNDLSCNGNIIMNPPFNLSLEFLQASLHETNKDIFLLQRLDWLSSKSRQQVMNQHLQGVLVLASRPTFYKADESLPVDAAYETRSGGTKDFAWYVFNNSPRAQFIKSI